MKQSAVEPHRRIERPVLVQTEPGQLFVKHLRVGLAREIAIVQAPIRDRARHAVNQLTHRNLALRRADLSIKIFGGHHVGRQHRPERRHFHVFLLKEDSAFVIADARRAFIPGDRIEGVLPLRAEDPRNLQTRMFFAGVLKSFHDGFLVAREGFTGVFG